MPERQHIGLLFSFLSHSHLQLLNISEDTLDQSKVVIDSSDNNDDNENYVGGRVGGGSDSSATSTGASVSVPPSSEDQASLAIGRSLKEQLRTTENELYDLEDQLAELQSRVRAATRLRKHLVCLNSLMLLGSSACPAAFGAMRCRPFVQLRC